MKLGARPHRSYCGLLRLIAAYRDLSRLYCGLFRPGRSTPWVPVHARAGVLLRLIAAYCGLLRLIAAGGQGGVGQPPRRRPRSRRPPPPPRRLPPRPPPLAAARCGLLRFVAACCGLLRLVASFAASAHPHTPERGLGPPADPTSRPGPARPGQGRRRWRIGLGPPGTAGRPTGRPLFFGCRRGGRGAALGLEAVRAGEPKRRDFGRQSQRNCALWRRLPPASGRAGGGRRAPRNGAICDGRVCGLCPRSIPEISPEIASFRKRPRCAMVQPRSATKIHCFGEILEGS